MSAFQPQSYEEAKGRFKPMKKGNLTRRSDSGDKPLLPHGIARKRASSAIPYATNSLNARKKKGKRKKLTDGQLKKRVWKEFSIFIRTRGADEHGINQCVTCDVRKHWKELQAGHFIRGRLNANLFDPRGVAPQCYSCNVGKQGNVVIFYKWMLRTFGQPVIDELIQQNNSTRKWEGGELQHHLEFYRAMNAANPLLKEQP